MIAKKCFGQNFLQNPHILDKIVDALELNSTDRILEVGPGPAYLTRKIIPIVSSYFAIEIDKQFSEILEALRKEYIHFQFVIDDFLRVPSRTFTACNKFVGNLPYNISTPILHRIATQTNIKTLVCMFAIGTAERFISKHGSLNYSAASVMAQSFFSIEKVMMVQKTQFTPTPKIDSMILKFIRKPVNHNSMIAFSDWAQPLFSFRRKTILNSFIQCKFSKDTANEILLTCHVNPGERVENIPLEKLYDLFQQFQLKETE